ncbi:hypothetical protein HP456_16305 [Bacillus haikouensis]|uniref:hypothetical protein n=1 Tax=Bacillus haikouensis TaxID=1510468 RepID=UPI00155665E3|nr:hypothetical protein [Bacillus haikouensis]NQD67478.1 hypothetical protein [Bacillus haikouensis]
MTGIFYIILVPILIMIISILITNSSKGTTGRNPGHSTYYGGNADSSDHCGGFDGGFGGGDGGGGGGD